MSQSDCIKIEYSSEKVWTKAKDAKRSGKFIKPKTKRKEGSKTKVGTDPSEVKVAFVIQKSAPQVERVPRDQIPKTCEGVNPARVVRSSIESRDLKLASKNVRHEIKPIPPPSPSISVKRTRSSCKLAKVADPSEKTCSFLTFARAVRNSVSTYNLSKKVSRENFKEANSSTWVKEEEREEEAPYHRRCRRKSKDDQKRLKMKNSKIDGEETPTYFMFFKDFEENSRKISRTKLKDSERENHVKESKSRFFNRRSSSMNSRVYNGTGCSKQSGFTSGIPVKKSNKPSEPEKIKKPKKLTEEISTETEGNLKMGKREAKKTVICKYVEEILNDDYALKNICKWLLTGREKNEAPRKSSPTRMVEEKLNPKNPQDLTPTVKHPVTNFNFRKSGLPISSERKEQRKMKKVRKTSQGKFQTENIKNNNYFKLRRHMSDPHTKRGFVWRKMESMPSCSKDVSIASVTSSLRHLNSEEVDDFVFWEAVPPQAGSYWEISLYKSRKPWSVLSFPVFKNNPDASSPALTLENKNGKGNLITNGASTMFSHRKMFADTHNAFDVEPSIAQKNIDIKNWVRTLNFYSPESKTKLSKEEIPKIEANSKMIDYGLGEEPIAEVLQKCIPVGTKSHKKFKTKFTNEKDPEICKTNCKSALPPEVPKTSKNSLIPKSPVNGKSNVVKSLLNMNGPVAGQTRFVYMYRMSQRSPKRSATPQKQSSLHEKTNRSREEAAKIEHPERGTIGDDLRLTRSKPLEDSKIEKSKERLVPKSSEISSRSSHLRTPRLEFRPSLTRLPHCSRSLEASTPPEKLADDVIAYLKADAVRRTMIEYGRKAMKRTLGRTKSNKEVPSQTSRESSQHAINIVSNIDRWLNNLPPVLKYLSLYSFVIFAILFVVFFSFPFQLLIIPF